jgi:3-oxoacyl-[acyl-carrier protein] reductase
MILKNKNAIIYGAGGSLGGAVAKALAASGANLYLTGRSISSVKKIAEDILKSGGYAEVEQVNATNEAEIENHIRLVKQKTGSVDISYNAVGIDVLQEVPLAKMSVDDYVNPITQTMHTHFMTAKAAANIMIEQQSGVILTVTATPGGIGYPYTGGFAPSCCALENFSKNLAIELGVYGVRVVNIRSGGSPDSAIFKAAMEADPEGMKAAIKGMEADTMLKKLPMLNDIANAAVFLSSDMAAKITGVTIDVTGGTTVGLNYKVNK